MSEPTQHTSLLKPMTIGKYTFPNNLALAPMAGVTDRPFRMLCRSLGAGIAAGEMLTSDVRLYHTRKSRLRMDHTGEPEPRIVQIAGGDAEMMAEAARINVGHGAQIIDINMGCPAKKVCNKAAGSALMKNEALVAQILEKTVAAVDVPVTLKIRTGWNQENKNALSIAKIAERSGIQALAIPEKALTVLNYTSADGLMIGRAAQGQPWVFREIGHYLNTGKFCQPLAIHEQRAIMCGHLQELYTFYGSAHGVRIARKHLNWYCKAQSQQWPKLANIIQTCRAKLVRSECSEKQLLLVRNMFAEMEDLANTSVAEAA